MLLTAVNLVDIEKGVQHKSRLTLSLAVQRSCMNKLSTKCWLNRASDGLPILTNLLLTLSFAAAWC